MEAKTFRHDNIIAAWIMWHFVVVPEFLFSVWKNYLWFIGDYFSIPLLAKTFFSPWRKYQSSYVRGFDFGRFISDLIFNLFSRLMGMLCRTLLIISGIIAELVVVVVGIVSIAAWIFLPLICLALVLVFTSL